MEGIIQLLKSNFEWSKYKWRHQCHAFAKKGTFFWTCSYIWICVSVSTSMSDLSHLMTWPELITAVFAYRHKLWLTLKKNCEKNQFLEYFKCFQLKNHIFCSKKMVNYGETIGTSLTFSIKSAMIREFFMANTPNSCSMLDWPVSIAPDNFWSTGPWGVSHNYGMWNWVQEKSPGEYVN